MSLIFLQRDRNRLHCDKYLPSALSFSHGHKSDAVLSCSALASLKFCKKRASTSELVYVLAFFCHSVEASRFRPSSYISSQNTSRLQFSFVGLRNCRRRHIFEKRKFSAFVSTFLILALCVVKRHTKCRAEHFSSYRTSLVRQLMLLNPEFCKLSLHHSKLAERRCCCIPSPHLPVFRPESHADMPIFRDVYVFCAFHFANFVSTSRT